MGEIDKRDILLSVAKSGEVFVNVGEVVNGEGIGSDIGTWMGYHISMPDEPDATGADQALVMRDGQGKRVIGVRCNRAVAKAGALSPGDSAQLSGGKARVLIKKEGDVFSAYTEMEDGTSMVITMDGAAGETLLAVGASYIQIKPGDIVINNGEAMFRLNGKNVEFAGNDFGVNMATGHFGAPGGIPPVAPAQGIAIGVAPGTASTAWSVAV